MTMRITLKNIERAKNSLQMECGKEEIGDKLAKEITEVKRKMKAAKRNGQE